MASGFTILHSGVGSSPDPAGYIDGTNFYQFVFNNPLGYTDLDGRFAIAIPIIVVTAEAVTTIFTTEALFTAALTVATFTATYQFSQYCNSHFDPGYNHLTGEYTNPCLYKDFDDEPSRGNLEKIDQDCLKDKGIDPHEVKEGQLKKGWGTTGFVQG